MNFNQEIISKNIVCLNPKNPFTWASGIKSPIYCDNRMILGYPLLRNFVIEEMVKLVKKNHPNVEIIMGTSTAGIPHATLIADRLNLGCGYVRSKAKEHGHARQVEGICVKGKKVVVIEDLLSTGKSSIQVINALKDEGANVIGLVAIFSYNLKKENDNFNEVGIIPKTVSNILMLLEELESSKKLSEEEVELIKKFLKNPNEWQK